MLRTHWVLPRGATRYRCPSKASRLTGVLRHSPLFRPFTSSTREPAMLIPVRVAPATSLLKTFLVNQPGSLKRSAISRFLQCPDRRRLDADGKDAGPVDHCSRPRPSSPIQARDARAFLAEAHSSRVLMQERSTPAKDCAS